MQMQLLMMKDINKLQVQDTASSDDELHIFYRLQRQQW